MSDTAVKGMARAKVIYRNRPERALELQQQGEKVIGYLCIYPVIEMLTAAGLAPFRMFGDMGASVLHDLSLAGPLDATAINQLGSNIAQAISIIIVLFWNFFANRLWTYNDV